MEEMDSSYKSIKKTEGLSTGGNKAGRHYRDLSIDLDPMPSLGNQSREGLPNQPKKKRMTMIVDTD